MATEHVSFDLTLDKEIRGVSELKNPVCLFHYDWDASTNTGIAMLQSINGTPVNITLHPIGLKNELDFMSDMEPTHYSVSASNDHAIALIDIIIDRVILDVDGAQRSAALMLGQMKDTIIGSEGFMTDSAAKQLPAVEFAIPAAPAE